jgi:5'-nucleotidase
MVISGINRGENLGAVAHLSGTVGAAMEATALGFPAIAVSLGRAKTMDYSYAARVAKTVALAVRQHGLPRGTCLNVNVPALPESQLQGIVVVPQSDWRGEVRHERRLDLFDRPYFLRGFLPAVPEAPPDTDVGAFSRGYVTITPIKLDWTDREVLPEIEKWGITTGIRKEGSH